MPLFKLDVFTDGGYSKKTVLGEFPDIESAERVGEISRNSIDPNAMYDIEEIGGIRQVYYRAVMRRNAWLRDI